LFAASALAALFAGVLPEKVDFDFFRFDYISKAEKIGKCKQSVLKIAFT
jgi:hypothetical protein